MPKIPVNPRHLPTEEAAMDETLTYTGFVRSLILSEKPSVSGLYFLKARHEVTEPDDFRGKAVIDNYIPIPGDVDDDMDAHTRQRIMESGVRLGRLLASAKVEGDADSFETEEVIGKEIRFTVKNEEFNGRLIPRVKDYLL